MENQDFLLSLGMGKRLTPEEREARIQAYEAARAEKQAAREEKRKARLEAYEKAKADRAAKREREKKGIKAAKINENSATGYVRRLPAFKGKLNIGDEVGFRFLGMAIPGTITDFTSEKHYKDEALGEDAVPTRGLIEFYTVQGPDGTFYPIKKNDILCKKVNGTWKEKA